MIVILLGKEELKKIKQEGIKRKQVGIEIDCEAFKRTKYYLLETFER